MVHVCCELSCTTQFFPLSPSDPEVVCAGRLFDQDACLIRTFVLFSDLRSGADSADLSHS